MDPRTPEGLREIRYAYLTNVAIPYVNAIARYSEPVFNKAALYVAQYWSDEAADAVHDTMLFFVDGPDVTLENMADFYAAEIQRGEYDKDEDEEVFRDGVVWDAWTTRSRLGTVRPFGSGVESRDYYNYYLPWDDNGLAVALWGRWCKYEGDQGADFHENYSLAVVFDIEDCDACDMSDDVKHRRTVTGFTLAPGLREHDEMPEFLEEELWHKYLEPWTPGSDRRRFWS